MRVEATLASLHLLWHVYYCCPCSGHGLSVMMMRLLVRLYGSWRRTYIIPNSNLSIFFLNIHREIWSLPLLKETFHYNRQTITETHKQTKWRVMDVSFLQYLPSPKAHDHCRRGRQRYITVRGSGNFLWDCLLLTVKVRIIKSYHLPSYINHAYTPWIASHIGPDLYTSIIIRKGTCMLTQTNMTETIPQLQFPLSS